MKKLLLILIIFLVTGCYNYTEINNLVLVNGISIDYKNNEYKLKFDIDKTIDTTGTNISDAIRNFEESIQKKPFYAHIKIITISSEVFKNHFNEVTEYLLRNNEIRNNFYLVISDDIKSVKSNHIKNIIINNNDIISSCLFKNIITKYLSNKELILPIISNNQITGSIIKNNDKYNYLDLYNARLYKIIKNKHPNIIYKNINIYHSKVKYKKNIYYINLDAELKESSKVNIKKELKKDLEHLLGKKVVLNIDINRNGQILNEE